MAVFPTLSQKVSASFDFDYGKPSVRTKFEGNYEQTRPKYTRSTHEFNVMYRFLNLTDVTTIRAFHDANLGGEFDWTNPEDNVTYLVRFAQDRLSFKHLGASRYEVKIQLTEV